MDEQDNQNNQGNQAKIYRNKILLAAAGVVVVAAVFYLMLRGDSETAQGDDAVKHEAVPAVVLNVSANKLWVSFPLAGDQKGEFEVANTASVVRLDFTSAGPQEVAIGLSDLKLNDNILVYYQTRNGDERVELNRVEFLNFPPPPVITDESRYQVLSVENKSSYRVKNLATSQETNLMVPSDARVAGGQVRVGSILKVNESSVLGNGILAFDLNVE
ncbi:MAG: hypothetical protein WAP55_01785 [Minisyncoccia bacterium]